MIYGSVLIPIKHTAPHLMNEDSRAMPVLYSAFMAIIGAMQDFSVGLLTGHLYNIESMAARSGSQSYKFRDIVNAWSMRHMAYSTSIIILYSKTKHNEFIIHILVCTLYRYEMCRIAVSCTLNRNSTVECYSFDADLHVCSYEVTIYEERDLCLDHN